MHTYPDEIARNIREHINTKNPELLQYIDNHYVDELLNLLIEGVSIELAKCLREDDLKRLLQRR